MAECIWTYIHEIIVYSVVPKPLIQANILSNQIVGESLTLQCTITTVRGITSRVDIEWSSDGSELKIIEGLNHSTTTNNSVIYTEFYTIPQLSTLDDARTLRCDMLINTISPVMATDSVTLNVTGKCFAVAYQLVDFII